MSHHRPTVERNARIGKIDLALVISTEHGATRAVTAIHRQNFKHRIGGARFVLESPGGGREEVAKLADAMADKCLTSGIPADGQKTIIVTTADVIDSEELKAAILAEHIRALAEVDPGVIVGPDMGNPEAVQERVAVDYGLMAHVTGLSPKARGLSIDDQGYTAQGLAFAIEALFAGKSLHGVTVSVQGFGAVGAHAAQLLGDQGARVVGVSNMRGVLIAKDGYALPTKLLFEQWRTLKDAVLETYHAAHPDTTEFTTDLSALFQVPAEIFIPAARTSALAMPDEFEGLRRRETAEAQDVVAFHKQTGVKIVVEGANQPLTDDAERYLEEQGVQILPDFIANCGGLIGCWVEWENRRDNPNDSSFDLVSMDQRTIERIRSTIKSNVAQILSSSKPSRKAAKEIADMNRDQLLQKG